MRAASSFADNVAKCPQRTYAILSRYDTVPTFIKYASKPGLELSIRHYEGVQSLTSDLLDTFLEYKSNLLIINDAINQPSLYAEAARPDAVSVTIETLIEERKKTKLEMRNIAAIIHTL
jgi:hypothetical protein